LSLEERHSEPVAMQTKAFLSYSHEDKGFAHPLYEELIRLGVDVWIDEVELLVGDSMIAKISESIADNDFVIAIVSPASLAAPWCQKELAIATTLGINEKRVKVLPVRLDSAQMPPSIIGSKYVDADRSAPEEAAEELAVAINRHLELMSTDVQRLIASTGTPPPEASTSGAWSGLPWTIERGPLAVAPTGRDAEGYGWEIQRQGEGRRVIVWISGSAMASTTGLPDEVIQAKATRGRSVVERLVMTDDPPTEVLAATYGIRLGVTS